MILINRYSIFILYILSLLLIYYENRHSLNTAVINSIVFDDIIINLLIIIILSIIYYLTIISILFIFFTVYILYSEQYFNLTTDMIHIALTLISV